MGEGEIVRLFVWKNVVCDHTYMSIHKSIFSALILVSVLLSTHGLIAYRLSIVLDGILPRPV